MACDTDFLARTGDQKEEVYFMVVNMVCAELSKEGWRMCVAVELLSGKEGDEFNELIEWISEIRIGEVEGGEEIRGLAKGVMGMVL